MKVVVTTETVGAMKAELRRILPETKSSHLAEALARGLGWATNAGMRAALADGGIERALDPTAFETFLGVRGLDNPRRALQDAVLRAQIRAVMSAYVQLDPPRLRHLSTWRAFIGGTSGAIRQTTRRDAKRACTG